MEDKFRKELNMRIVEEVREK
jgi:hypothetical protein